MRRRTFIKGIAALGVAWPFAARAQQPVMPVIGLLHSEAPDLSTSPILRAFRQGLSESGYVEGQNVAIEYRRAESQYDRLPALAAELVERRATALTVLRRRRHSGRRRPSQSCSSPAAIRS